MKYVFGYIQMWKLIAKKHSYMEIGRTLVLFFPWETSIRLFLQFLSLPSPSQGCVDTSLVVREERAFSVCSNASWNFLPLLVLGRMRRRARFSNLAILDSFVVSLTHPSSVHAGGKTIGFHSFSQLFSLLHCWWLKRGWREMESLGADGWRNEKPAPAFSLLSETQAAKLPGTQGTRSSRDSARAGSQASGLSPTGNGGRQPDCGTPSDGSCWFFASVTCCREEIK